MTFWQLQDKGLKLQFRSFLTTDHSKTYGGGAAGEVQKKYSRKGKLNKKILARQLIVKNIHAMA